VAIANAQQLETARRFNYDAMQSLKSLNLSAAVLQRFAADTLLYAVNLTSDL